MEAALIAALAGAGLGGLLAWFATEWAFRRTQRAAQAEVERQEIAMLEGLIFEIDLAVELAERASPTPCPCSISTT